MRGRVLILLGAIILLAVVVVVVLMFNDGGGKKEPAGTETPEPSAGQTTTGLGQAEEDVEYIVIAVQDIERGEKFDEASISQDPDTQTAGLYPWPRSVLPPRGSYYLDPNELVGQIARTDIVRGAPILRAQVTQDLRDIAAAGSDAAAILPEGRVAVAVPLDPSGIGQAAYGIQDGDYVDIILSFLFVDVDEAFQTRLPNTISIITTNAETGELTIGAPRQGRVENVFSPTEPSLVGPSEASQRPRLVTQLTVTDAFVVHMGYFPEGGDFIGATPTPMPVTPPPTPPGQATPVPQQQQQQPASPQATATLFTPLIITLGVTPQDALFLVWAIDAQIPITLVLRAAGDRSDHRIRVEDGLPIESVTLQYMISTFRIAQPDALPYAVEPPITSVRRFDIATLYDFLGEAVTGQ